MLHIIKELMAVIFEPIQNIVKYRIILRLFYVGRYTGLFLCCHIKLRYFHFHSLRSL